MNNGISPLIGFLLHSTGGRALTTCLCILCMEAKLLWIKLLDLHILYWPSNSKFLENTNHQRRILWLVVNEILAVKGTNKVTQEVAALVWEFCTWTWVIQPPWCGYTQLDS